MKNRKNNKGFSLVELIVVVAIMAVLVGVLAPAYLKYVENSRQSKDKNNAEEIRHAVEIALANETVNEKLGTSNVVITITDANETWAVTGTTDSGSALLTEVQSTVPKKLDLTSKLYNGGTYTITINVTTSAVTGVLAAPAA